MGNGSDKVKIMMMRRKTGVKVKTKRHSITNIFQSFYYFLPKQPVDVMLISSQLKSPTCPSHKNLNVS